jgi:16S rRNA (guanine527-N7)-methyltransferase
LNRLSVGLGSEKASLLARYAALIRAANERAGLVSKGDLEAIEQRHFAESLALGEALQERRVLLSPVIDIGSGAGFPGLPMKIAWPALEMTLLEATAKKAAFLKLAIAELGLTGVRVVMGRAEDAGRDPAHRGAYALALARAVAPLPALIELALPFLRPGGVLASPKGSAALREVAESEKALREIGGAVVEVTALPIEGRGPVPTLIIIRKDGPTPERYPRRAGMPRKRPL